GQRCEIEIERRLALHAERSRVDEEGRAGERARRAAPSQALHRPPERTGEALGPRRRAVDEADLRRAGIDEGLDDRARTAAGAEHDRRAVPRVETARAGAQGLDEAVAIGVAAGN